MKHNIDSGYWTDERRRRETRELIASVILLVVALFLAVIWVNACDVQRQIAEPAPLPCEMTSTTTGHCPQ